MQGDHPRASSFDHVGCTPTASCKNMLLRRVLEGVLEEVLRQVLRRCLARAFTAFLEGFLKRVLREAICLWKR